jgi:transposase
MSQLVPTKLRLAIVRLREEKRSYQEIASLLGVGEATVSRVMRLKRETGSVERRPRGGGNFSPICGRIAELLHAIVAQMPDATVAELTEALAKKGRIETSRSSVQRALSRLGYSRKKSPSWRRSETPPSTGSGTARSARSSPR